jgi:ATP-binding protein involved in chromosome partitioning
VSFRTYNEVQGEDRSRLLEQVVAQRTRVADRLRGVERTIAVISGKGGVGKSYVTAGLARALARERRVGVIDGDLQGPTAARLLGATGPLHVGESGVEPAMTADGIRVMSTDLLLAEGAPFRARLDGGERFTRRGIVEAGVLREFFSDVAWGTLDLLLADLAPGAHALEDLAELVPGVTGVLVVTIPSDESRRAVARNVRRAGECGVRVLGIVENMSGYECGGCGEMGPLFSGTAGTDLAAEFGVPLLARLPFVGWTVRRDDASQSERLTALAKAVLEVTS